MFNCRSFLLIVLLFTASSLCGCLTTTTNRGYTLDEEALKQLSIGTTTKEEVLKTMGSPSTYNDYGDETWYYVSKEQQSVAFLKPKITKESVIAIHFNNDGTLTDVKHYSEKDMKDIVAVQEHTPTYGKDLSIIQQFLGNIGRYNSRAIDYSKE
ncbi:MAG: outer membrane protein assembly factor BamE [Alphaproteobacteria bacterium]|nr:outer membrane protein assembly factor BamE [Alphaproteobacteria bacterium]